jgi:hypothetical protein
MGAMYDWRNLKLVMSLTAASVPRCDRNAPSPRALPRRPAAACGPGPGRAGPVLPVDQTRVLIEKKDFMAYFSQTDVLEYSERS